MPVSGGLLQYQLLHSSEPCDRVWRAAQSHGCMPVLGGKLHAREQWPGTSG